MRRVAGPADRGSNLARIAAEALAALMLISVVGVLPASVAPEGRAALASALPVLPGSLGFAALAAAIALLAGWPIGRLGGVAVAVALVPMVLPAALHASGWRAIIGSTEILGRPWSIASPWVAAPVTGLRFAGLVALVAWMTPIQNAADDPVHRVMPVRRARWNLQWRPMLPAGLAAIGLAGVMVIGDHVTPGLLLVSTWGTQILLQHAALLDATGAAALGAPVLVLAGLVSVAIAWSARRGGWAAAPGSDRPDRLSRPSRDKPRASAKWIIALVPAAPPVVALLLVLDGPAQLEEAMRTMGPELRRTIWPAMLAGGLSAGGGWLLAAGWSVARRRGRGTLVPAAVATVVVPAAIPGLNLLAVLSGGPGAGWLDGLGPLVVVWTIRALPIATVIVLVGAAAQRREAELAGVLGVTAVRRAARLTWPRRGPSMIAAFVVCTLVCMADADVAVLLGPPGFTTAGVRLSTLLHTAPQSLVAASALVAAGSALVFAGIASVVLAAIGRGLAGLAGPRFD
ncbi:MAG: hypothetical protein AB8G96_11260 [Phycisphaerales bacterium]